MLKDIFHKNAVEIFNLLEKTSTLKLSRRILSSKIKGTKNIPLWKFMLMTPELHKSNDWYGHATILKKYAGINNDYAIKAAIEHGSFFGHFIWPQDLNQSLSSIITFSKKRAEFLRKKTHKEIFSIGPYIHYANQHLSKKKLQKEIKRLNKNLLVFPVHSTTISTQDYDIEEFCRAIKNAGKKFDSIRICLYWKDILDGKDKFYKKYGFEIVTAGHIFDPSFLPRLKSIIEVANQTMSNAVGTHLGYSVFMKKPVLIFRQKFKFPKNDVDAKRARVAMLTPEHKKLEYAFSKKTDRLTGQQYNLASSFFGFDQIKSKRALRRIILV